MKSKKSNFSIPKSITIDSCICFYCHSSVCVCVCVYVHTLTYFKALFRCARPSGVPRGPATSTGSLASQRHPGKFPKVPGRRRGKRLRGLEGVPGLPGAPQDEAGLTRKFDVLAWRIPGTGEPDGLPSMGSNRVGHD